MTERDTHQQARDKSGRIWVGLSLVFAVTVIGGALLWVGHGKASSAASGLAQSGPAAGAGSSTSAAASADSSVVACAVVERSDRVEALQRELARAGVYAGALDGVYGPATQASLKTLQRQVGVAQTGLLDQTTWKAAAAKGLLKTSQTVMSLQLALKTLGLFDGAINGKYDVATELAIRAFQRNQGMPADGVWSPTLDAEIEQTLDSSR